MTSAELLPAAVLNRKAVVYIRQSTQAQVQTNLEKPAAAIRPRRCRAATGLPQYRGDR